MSSTSQTGVTTTFAYDAFQREVSQTDGRGNTTRTVYDNFGRVASSIDALGHSTTYGYDALGRQTSVTNPLTNTVYTAFDVEGHVIAQRGATYPVDYAYDEFGEKISMTTYRDLNASGDATRWLRDEATGLVTNKVYADGKGPTYTYTPDGKLATRIWARGIVTTYSYDDKGKTTRQRWIRRFVELEEKSRNFDFAFEDDNGRMVGASQFYDPDHSKFGESEDSSDSMIITRTQGVQRFQPPSLMVSI